MCENKLKSLELSKNGLISKHEYLIELSERLKDQDNDSKDLMDIIGKMQYVTLEIGQIEMQIKYAEREIRLINMYESISNY